MTEDEFIESMEDLRLLAQLFDTENTIPLEGFARERVGVVVRRIGKRLMANIPDQGALRTELFNYQERWISDLKEAARPTAVPEHKLYGF